MKWQWLSRCFLVLLCGVLLSSTTWGQDWQDSLEPEVEQEKVEGKSTPTTPLAKELFPIGIRFSFVVSTLRGSAFTFENNIFGYDQIVGFPGMGGELEFSYHAFDMWKIYASVDWVRFKKTTDSVSVQIPPTPPNTDPITARNPIYFQGWKLVNVAIGGKLYPFPEDWLRPFMKFGFGFTIQSELKSLYQGTTTIHFESRASFAIELGVGLEFLWESSAFHWGLVIEAMLGRIFKQVGPLVRLDNNTYSFPIKFGVVVYF